MECLSRTAQPRPSTSASTLVASRQLACTAAVATATHNNVPRRRDDTLAARSARPPRSDCGAARASRRVLCRAEPGPGERDPYEALFRSEVFKSDMVQKDFSSIVKELMDLSRMASQFVNFDLEGKKMFLDQMEKSSDRYEVFVKRLELSSDPGAAEYLRATNAQMLEGGFTLPQMFQGLKQGLDEYRKWIAAEEQVIADPIKHQQFLKEFRTVWSRSALGGMDFGKLSNMDVSMLDRAQRDPQFWKAIKEIADNPTDLSVMRKWMEDPNIGPLVMEMWKAQMSQQQ